MSAEASPSITARLRDYALLMRLDKPIGILLLLWPTMWALWLASAGRPDPWILVVFVLGVILMRSAGCVVNDFADRDFDPHVSRTRDRPLAARRVSEREALVLFAVLGLSAFALVLTTNALTIKLSFAGIALAAIYPFVKRVSSVPQLFLGVAFSWGIPMAFAAQTGSVKPIAGWLMLANLFWVVAYDTMYAMVDRQDDLRVGVRSTAILFGSMDRFAVGLCQLLTLGLLILVARNAALGAWFYLGLAVAALLMCREQWLIRAREPDACFRAFIDNYRVGMVIFAGIGLHYVTS